MSSSDPLAPGLAPRTMPAMRPSLTSRFISHPSIDFPERRAARQQRLGLGSAHLTFIAPVGARREATVAALRSPTSRFRFPSVGSVGRVSPRRAILPLGLPRARRG